MNLLGVILSGGKSTRMGSEKGLMDYHGKPMIQYAIDLIEPFCVDIVISANTAVYLKFGYQIIPDLLPDIGPIGGIFSVMNMQKADSYFFISCDIPHASRKLAEELLKHIDKGDIIVPVHSDNKIEPLFAIYSSKVFPIVRNQIENEDYKLMDLLSLGNTYYHKVSDDFLKENTGLFKNINTPRDVE